MRIELGMPIGLSVRLFVRMIQPENRWADLDEIWYGRYTIGVYPKIVCYKLVQ
jgi:hypothetical protein